MKDFYLGTVQLGMKYGITNEKKKPSLNESIDILKYAFKHSFVGVDTAAAYGASEEVIGAFISSNPDYRFKIQTKLMPQLNPISDVIEQINSSFEKLKVNYVDVFMFHRYEDKNSETARNQLSDLKANDRISSIGCSISTPTELEGCLQDKLISFIQLPFNLLDWRWLTEDLQGKLKLRSDLHIQARSMFLQGLLLAEADKYPQFPNLDSKRIVNDITKLTYELGFCTRMDLCYSYVYSQPWLNSIVIGVGSVSELKQNIQCTPRLLSSEELLHIQSVFNYVPDLFLNPVNW